jgi:hypothetical protein
MNKSERVFSILVRIISAGLLLWALDRHPYDYFTIMRWIVFASSSFCFYLATKSKQSVWLWVFGIIGLLFNPIIPIHLARKTWSVVDVVSALVLVVSIFVFHTGGARDTKNSGGDYD